VSLVIRGSPEHKNGLALGKGFKAIGSDTRIIHDTTVDVAEDVVEFADRFEFEGFAWGEEV
jgi:hypothetical protein